MLSVVVVVYDMARELPWTLYSLDPRYQRGISADEYEVIVVDNGSPEPVPDDLLADFAGDLRLERLDPAPPSPARAANHGIATARGDLVGLIVDGARLASPGLLATAWQAARLSDRPVVTAPAFHLGASTHMRAGETGHDQTVEDALLAESGWQADGYRLFGISTPAGSSGRGLFGPMGESSSLFATRGLWAELGGMDERFALPGGGLANHDLYLRACSRPDVELLVLLGEATFHQYHGARRPPGGTRGTRCRPTTRRSPESPTVRPPTAATTSGRSRRRPSDSWSGRPARPSSTPGTPTIGDPRPQVHFSVPGGRMQKVRGNRVRRWPWRRRRCSARAAAAAAEASPRPPDRPPRHDHDDVDATTPDRPARDRLQPGQPGAGGHGEQRRPGLRAAVTNGGAQVVIAPKAVLGGRVDQAMGRNLAVVAVPTANAGGVKHLEAFAPHRRLRTQICGLPTIFRDFMLYVFTRAGVTPNLANESRPACPALSLATSPPASWTPPCSSGTTRRSAPA